MSEILESKEFADLKKRSKMYKWGKAENFSWSDWGLLFRFLVIICYLLAERRPLKKTDGRRKFSAWAKFAEEQMSIGKTIKEASVLWRERVSKNDRDFR